MPALICLILNLSYLKIMKKEIPYPEQKFHLRKPNVSYTELATFPRLK